MARWFLEPVGGILVVTSLALLFDERNRTGIVQFNATESFIIVVSLVAWSLVEVAKFSFQVQHRYAPELRWKYNRDSAQHIGSPKPKGTMMKYPGQTLE
jgi:hypothetical protein